MQFFRARDLGGPEIQGVPVWSWGKRKGKKNIDCNLFIILKKKNKWFCAQNATNRTVSGDIAHRSPTKGFAPVPTGSLSRPLGSTCRPQPMRLACIVHYNFNTGGSKFQPGSPLPYQFYFAKIFSQHSVLKRASQPSISVESSMQNLFKCRTKGKQRAFLCECDSPTHTILARPTLNIILSFIKSHVFIKLQVI